MTTVTSHSQRSLAAAEDYLELVRRFPLRPLRAKAEHKAAIALLSGLVGREGLTAGESDYVDALAHFVEAYERATAESVPPTMSPLEALRQLMDQNDMNTTDLGYVVGSCGLASEILNGKRGLSKAVIRRLAERFRVSPALFIEGPTGTSFEGGKA